MQYYMDPGCWDEEMRLIFRRLGIRHVLTVCGKSACLLPVCHGLEKLAGREKISVTYFRGFSPNPEYGDILEGVRAFRDSGCDCILAIGGGSAIDVAKCIKMFSGLRDDADYLKQDIEENGIPLLAVPTTAGTGSEATCFAVIYVNGNKYSVEHASALPGYVLLHPDNLATLPDYQKKATMCDALSHAVESFWSVRSTGESRKLSANALEMALEHMEGYLENSYGGRSGMLLASNLAGQAINAAKTTAAHAMSYRLAAMLNIPHGHAVMLCLPEVWEHMLGNMDGFADAHERRRMEERLRMLAGHLKQDGPEEAVRFLKGLRSRLGLEFEGNARTEQMEILTASVNAERLGNFPLPLAAGDIYGIYRKILKGGSHGCS